MITTANISPLDENPENEEGFSSSSISPFNTGHCDKTHSVGWEPQSTLATDDADALNATTMMRLDDGEPLGSRMHKYTRPEIVCTAARKLEGRALVAGHQIKQTAANL